MTFAQGQEGSKGQPLFPPPSMRRKSHSGSPISFHPFDRAALGAYCVRGWGSGSPGAWCSQKWGFEQTTVGGSTSQARDSDSLGSGWGPRNLLYLPVLQGDSPSRRLVTRKVRRILLYYKVGFVITQDLSGFIFSGATDLAEPLFPHLQWEQTLPPSQGLM